MLKGHGGHYGASAGLSQWVWQGAEGTEEGRQVCDSSGLSPLAPPVLEERANWQAFFKEGLQA